MTSKEALEELYNNLGCEECQNVKCKYKQSTINDCDVWRNTVKQDLDRLEKLEEDVDDLLDDKLELVIKNKQQDTLIGKLIEENSKLKKVIDILKNKGVQESFLKNTKNVNEYNKAIKHLNYFDELTQEEYDLLKEYLDD